MAGHADLLRVPFRDGFIACQVLGSAEAPWLVMCHGMGLDRQNMLPLAERFSADWRVLLWDMPGHGDSPQIPDTRIELFAEALAAVVDACEVRDAVLVGFSFGGTVAQYAVRNEPGQYRALIAYGCYAPFHQPAPVSRTLLGGVLAAYRLQSWARIKRDFAQACAISDAGQAETLRAVSRSSKAVFVGMVRALLESFRPEPNLDFALPLLLVRGAEDSNSVHLGIAAARVRAACPHALEVVVPQAGHCAHDDAFDAVAAALSGFLRSL